MSQTCAHPSCDAAVGQQDRDDYRDSRFCSVQCDVALEHLKADASDALQEAHQ